MKAKVPAKSVDEYLARVPEPARSTLQHIRAVIRSVVPAEATEVISYGIPMFKYNGMLVGYAAFKNHCSLFPTGSSVLDQFEKELRGYRTSKGTIQFPPDRALPDRLVIQPRRTMMASVRVSVVLSIARISPSVFWETSPASDKACNKVNCVALRPRGRRAVS